MPKSQLYTAVVRCFSGICSLLSPEIGHGTSEARNWSQGKPCRSQYLSQERLQNDVSETVVFREVECQSTQLQLSKMRE